MVTMKRIAIIPARGGSKRIPKKNIIDFHGKPLIAWTIEAAIKSNLFDRIVVSTDSEEIAEISERFGAQVPFMRNVNADDYTNVSLATTSALIQSEKYFREIYDVVTQLMPTCPLRSSFDICKAIENFDVGSAPSQISCTEFGWCNPWWAAMIGDDKKPSKIFLNSHGQRSQDLPRLYCPTGATWVAKSQFLKKVNDFYGPNHVYFQMDWLRSIDIDDDYHLSLAAMFHKFKADA